MQDFLEKYSRHTFYTHLSLMWVSLVLAFWIYFFVWDTNVANMLKTNVREATNSSIESKGDVFLQIDDSDTSKILLLSSKNISQVKALSLTLTYDPEKIDINGFKSLQNDASITNLSNEDWVTTLFIQYDTPRDIVSTDYLLVIQTTKKTDELVFLNLSNVNFKDGKQESYFLNTSGIDF